MSAFRSTALGDCLTRAQTWNPLRSPSDAVFRYIDLSSVDQDTKAVSDAREVTCGEAPSRARQLVMASDVLVSTVRPNLNGVARVDAELDGHGASPSCQVSPGTHWVLKIGPQWREAGKLSASAGEPLSLANRRV